MFIGFTMIPIGAENGYPRGWRKPTRSAVPHGHLQWEYLANILYATVIRRFPKPMLAIFFSLRRLPHAQSGNGGMCSVYLRRGSYTAYTVIGG